jgi:hypothetical protein
MHRPCGCNFAAEPIATLTDQLQLNANQLQLDPAELQLGVNELQQRD